MPFIQRGTIATLRQSIHICANAKEMRPMYLLRLQQITSNNSLTIAAQHVQFGLLSFSLQLPRDSDARARMT
jgi:hypothetical protein